MPRRFALLVVTLLFLGLSPTLEAKKIDSSEGLVVRGEVAKGQKRPKDLKVVVLWNVDGPDGDYVYKWGEAPLQKNGAFALKLRASKLPAQATIQIETFALGVGLIALVPRSYKLPDGKLTRKAFDALKPKILGNARRHGLIFRKGSTRTIEKLKDRLAWPNAFEESRISCGVGVDAAKGKTFDTFRPVKCKGIPLHLGKIEWVNWT